MADRYYTTFKAVLEAKYDMHIVDIFLDFQKREMDYSEISSEVGFHVSTVKKWSYRYGFRFISPDHNFNPKYSRKNPAIFLDLFRSKKINSSNLLSRRWV
jgi:hypothetical protein